MSKILTFLILAVFAVPIGATAETDRVDLDIVMFYRRSLPPLEAKDLLATDKASAIVDYVHYIGGGETLNPATRADHITRLEAKITPGELIEFVILGFPFKSTNTQKKVLEAFDMADYFGLIRLEHIAEQIESAVGVPCKIHIINEEPYIPEIFAVASGILGISLLDPERSVGYKRVCSHLVRLTCPHLTIGYDLTPQYEKQKSHSVIDRAKIEREAEKKVTFFSCELDHVAVNDELRKKLKEQGGKYNGESVKAARDGVAMKMATAYEAGVTVFRDVVSTHPVYGNMFRLSVHGGATRMMMNFLHTPGEEPTEVTCVPWHAALLCDCSRGGLSFSLRRRNQMPDEAAKAARVVADVPLAFMLKK